MARVTDDEVKEIIDTDRITDPFIDTANLIVTEELAASGHSDARLRQIELYLAAHFVALAEERGGLQLSETGDGSESVANVYEEGFKMTRYGQQALAFDTSGKLAQMNASAKNLPARFVVV